LKRLNKLNKKLTKLAAGILAVLMVSVAISSPAYTWSNWTNVSALVQITGTNQFRTATGRWRSRVSGFAVDNLAESQLDGNNACNIAVSNSSRVYRFRSLAHAESTNRAPRVNDLTFAFRHTCP